MLLTAKTRKNILKLPLAREVSNLLVNVSNKRFYNKLNEKSHYGSKLKRLKSTAKRERVFIVGNGPSLSMQQLEQIKNEDCFGANRIYKIFTETEWRPLYYVIQDVYDPTPTSVYEGLNIPYLFISDFYWRHHGMQNPKAICYHINRELHQTDKLPFSDQVSKFVQAASTVTYTMIQLAVYFGYKEIYLIGMDHTYANITDDKGRIIRKNNVRSHVFNDEKPNEVIANIQYMELAYRTARAYCERQGIKIYNATIGGALEVFDRVDFYDLFVARS
jgi:hypothetical protein